MKIDWLRIVGGAALYVLVAQIIYRIDSDISLIDYASIQFSIGLAFHLGWDLVFAPTEGE